MRGEVIHYDGSQGFGFITADDGNRYAFERSDMRQPASIAKGLRVDFSPQAGRANGIYPVSAANLAKAQKPGRKSSRLFQFMTALGFTG